MPPEDWPLRVPTLDDWLSLPEWVRRQLHIWYDVENGCHCLFEDCDEFPESSHPTPGCPLRTDCCGWTMSGPPCGGCDRCIVDQVIYYRGKERERRQQLLEQSGGPWPGGAD